MTTRPKECSKNGQKRKIRIFEKRKKRRNQRNTKKDQRKQKL